MRMKLISALGAGVVAVSTSGCAKTIHTYGIGDGELRGSISPEQIRIEMAERKLRELPGKIIKIIESKEATDFPIGQKVMCSSSRREIDARNIILCHEGIHKNISIVTDSPENREKMDTVRSISLQVVQPETDQKIYNREEVWNYPVEKNDGFLVGDCEDYVIFHMNLLKEYGIPEFALRPIIVEQSNGEGHLILAVIMDTGMYILDNINPENIFVRDFSELQEQTGYTVLKIVGNNGSFLWKDIITNS